MNAGRRYPVTPDEDRPVRSAAPAGRRRARGAALVLAAVAAPAPLHAAGEASNVSGAHGRRQAQNAHSQFVFSTYLGGFLDSYVQEMKTDEQGNLYLVGGTDSTELLVHAAIQPELAGTHDPDEAKSDIFVMKISPSGQLIYSTYLGGGNSDRAYAALPAADGSVTILGESSSADFPLSPAGGAVLEGVRTAVMVTLNRDGSALQDSRILPLPVPHSAVRLPSGDIALGGLIRSGDGDRLAVQGFQRVAGGAIDGFVASVSADGGVVRGFSYIGGSGAERRLRLTGGPDGSFYASVTTASTDLPVLRPLWRRISPGDEHHAAARIAGDCSQLEFSTYTDEIVSSATEICEGSDGSLFLMGSGPQGRQGHNWNRLVFRLLELNADGQSLNFRREVRYSEAHVPFDVEPSGDGKYFLLATRFGAEGAGNFRGDQALLVLSPQEARLQRAAGVPPETVRLAVSPQGTLYLLGQLDRPVHGQSPPGFLFRPLSTERTTVVLSHLKLEPGDSSGRLWLSRDSVDFGQSQGGSDQAGNPGVRRRTVTIRNLGSGDLEGWVTEATGFQGQFSTLSGAGPYRLSRGESREIVVEWTPASDSGPGPDHGSFTITSTDSRRPAVRIFLEGKRQRRSRR